MTSLPPASSIRLSVSSSRASELRCKLHSSIQAHNTARRLPESRYPLPNEKNEWSNCYEPYNYLFHIALNMQALETGCTCTAACKLCMYNYVHCACLKLNRWICKSLSVISTNTFWVSISYHNIYINIIHEYVTILITI